MNFPHSKTWMSSEIAKRAIGEKIRTAFVVLLRPNECCILPVLFLQRFEHSAFQVEMLKKKFQIDLFKKKYQQISIQFTSVNEIRTLSKKKKRIEEGSVCSEISSRNFLHEIYMGQLLCNTSRRMFIERIS